VTVRIERHQGWAELILASPQNRNALSDGMLAAISDAVLGLDADRGVNAILLRAEGPDFCTGYFQNTGGRHGDQAHTTFDTDIAVLEIMQRHLLSIMDCHIPVVAQIHGRCTAGGTDLAFMCDIVYAAPDARIGFPPARDIGSPPNPMWLYHIGPQWAKRLLLSGDLISGADAARIGLVLKALDEAGMQREVVGLMKRFGRMDRDLLAAQKRSVGLGLELMGARTMLRFGPELDARGHQSAIARSLMDASKPFDAKQLVADRKEKFGDGMLRVDEADPCDEEGRLI